MVEDPRFGTDGVRGVANADLSAHFAFRLGRAAGVTLGADQSRPRFLLGRDPRRSGDLLATSLAAGLLSVGADVVELGVIPTAGVAYLTRRHAAAAGIVLSASHNPAPDNGIKFFGPDGRKISDDQEIALEHTLKQWESLPFPTGADVGSIRPGTPLVEEYLRFLCDSAPTTMRGMRVVVDCGNGAASELGPRLVALMGAEPLVVAASPDGMNINEKCGALHPEAAQEMVVRRGADFGVSFDGDADRAIFCDEQGRLVDGDRVMALCALAWKGTDLLPGDQVVGTVMSNVGLELGLAEHGIRFHRAAVGDRHVAALMAEHGAALGGEKSGHIILSRWHTTGDGLLTMLAVAGVIAARKQPLSSLAEQIREYPQVLKNIRVWRRRGWRTQPELWEAVHAAQARLEGRGRVLVRASGTERIIRVMVEGPDEREVRAEVEALASVVDRTMGSPPPGVED